MEREESAASGRPGREGEADLQPLGFSREATGEADGVLTLVCFKCGTEYYFAEGEPPPELSCGKCGNTVFRSFYSALDDDEVANDFEESTARDLDPDDAEGESTPGDVIDLNRG